MSALDSLGKSIGEVIDERMSSPLLSSFTIAWVIINYKFFVILFSDTPVSQTFLLIHNICFPDFWALASRGFLYPLGAALFYLFVLPKPSQYVYEHWRKLQKWKNGKTILTTSTIARRTKHFRNREHNATALLNCLKKSEI